LVEGYEEAVLERGLVGVVVLGERAAVALAMEQLEVPHGVVREAEGGGRQDLGSKC
jgi:hypothetical protein